MEKSKEEVVYGTLKKEKHTLLHLAWLASDGFNCPHCHNYCHSENKLEDFEIIEFDGRSMWINVFCGNCNSYFDIELQLTKVSKKIPDDEIGAVCVDDTGKVIERQFKGRRN